MWRSQRPTTLDSDMAKVIQKQVSFNTERVVRCRFKSSLTYTKLVKKIRYRDIDEIFHFFFYLIFLFNSPCNQVYKANNWDECTIKSAQRKLNYEYN